MFELSIARESTDCGFGVVSWGWCAVGHCAE